MSEDVKGIDQALKILDVRADIHFGSGEQLHGPRRFIGPFVLIEPLLHALQEFSDGLAHEVPRPSRSSRLAAVSNRSAARSASSCGLPPACLAISPGRC